MTEDKVREKAGKILGLKDTETAISGVGQITSFNQLGFIGVKDRPDGWYLPNETTFPAIILEAKSEKTTFKKAHIDELLKNIAIIETKYKKNIGLLYNGNIVQIYKDGVFLQEETELKKAQEIIEYISSPNHRRRDFFM